tara:strand:- start:372 stop:1097 length:726 start_codon:yes stop_codon:yes gene_type:complete
MTRILSFDVGIINLAYCLIEFSDNKKKILDWGIIDLMDIFLQKCIKCCCINKGTNCDGMAINYIKKNDIKLGYCKKVKCQKIMKSLYKDSLIKKIKKINTKSISLIDKTSELIRQLRKNDILLTADIVVIENQPVLKNPVMKSIQMVIYSYFLIYGVTADNPISNIALFNAGKKLDFYDGPSIDCDHIKNDYSKRKYKSIKITEYLLKNDSHYLNFFNKSKKKDDLADSYIQCLTYHKKNF